LNIAFLEERLALLKTVAELEAEKEQLNGLIAEANTNLNNVRNTLIRYHYSNQ